MTKKADLHVHTYYSDGASSPSEVVQSAAKMGLSAIAVCDHDCIDGLIECREAAIKYGIELVPGVEVTAEIHGIEIHILGYFIDTDNTVLVKMLETLRESRIKRIYSMIDKLREHKLNILPEEVFGLSTRGSIGRLHLATALCEKKLVRNRKEAFDKYLADDAPCYVARFNAQPEDAIGAILKAGGVPVYAHPGAMGRDDFIPTFLKAGLRGLEVYHSDHKKKTTQYYLNLAQKYGLLVTGGSDCHGSHKARMGSVTVPYSIVEGLRREAEDIKNSRS